MSEKKSQFIEIEALTDSQYLSVFGSGVDRKISVPNFKSELKKDDEFFYADTVFDLANQNLDVGIVAYTKGCLSIGDGGYGTFIVEAASGTPDGYSRVLLANGNHAVLQTGDNCPEQFGAANDGVTDDFDALERFYAFFGYLKLRSGLGYAYEGTLEITNSGGAIIGEGSATTKLIPLSNFGDFVKIARAGGPLRGFVMCGVTIYCPATCTEDALVMDGVRNFAVYDVVIDRGNRGLVISGCAQGNFDNITIIYENDNGGTTTDRRYIYIEETANANISSKHPGDLFFSNINGRCGGTSYCYTGLEIHSGDGIWFSNYHFGNCTNTNVHIIADRAARCTGLKFNNGWHDLGTGCGTIIEGSTPTTIGDYRFSSVKSLGGNIGDDGFRIDGSATDIYIANCKISAYDQSGIDIAQTFTGSIYISDTDVKDCSMIGSGVHDAVVDRSTNSVFKMSGGTISGANHRWSINCQFGKTVGSNWDVFNVAVGTGTSGTIFYTPTAGNRVQDCPGFNPNTPTAPTVGASPYTFTNNYGYPVSAHLYGGTVSQIERNGVVLTGLTSVDTVIGNGGTLTVTYTVAPTLKIFGL